MDEARATTGRERGRKPKVSTPRPRWQVVAIEAKRAALAALPVEEQEAAKLAQIAARARFAARKEAKRAMARAIYTRLFAGATLAEIAAAIGRTKQNVRDICDSYGLPIAEKKGHRRAPMTWLSDKDSAALDALAADMGVDRAEVLEAIMRAALADGGHVARRTLGIRKRAA